MDIYGQFGPRLHDVLTRLTAQIKQLSHQEVAAGRPKLYEHLIGRVKTPASMAEKCQRKGFAVSTHAALRDCQDAVGVRIVCNFIDDVYRSLKLLRQASWCQIVEEKD